MRKRVYGKKLSRKKDSRRALLRGLVRALVSYGSVKTTKAKAKAVQAEVDKLVNLAKKDNQNKKKRIYARLGNDKKTMLYIIKKIAPAFKKRQSGFTRIVRLSQRRGDMADMVRLEWVKDISEEKEKKKGKKDKKLKEKSRKSKKGKK